MNDDIILTRAISTEQAKEVIRLIEAEPDWKEATTFGNLPEYRKTEVDYITQRPRNKSLGLTKAHNILAEAFVSAMVYAKEFYNKEQEHFAYVQDEGFQVLKYKPGCFYKEHVDSGPNVYRIISTVLFLNDNYEGGELYFPRQDRTIKGSAGECVVFPSIYTHPHIAKEIKEGTKYTCVTWWR